MNSMNKYNDGVRPFIFSATQLLSKVTTSLMNFSALSIIGAVSAKASACVAIGSLVILGFIVSFVAVAFVALVFGVGILGLMGAFGGLIFAILIVVSVGAILITGSIFVPAGFLLVAGFFSMIFFSTAVTIVDPLPACSLVAAAFLALTLLAIFL